MSNQYYLNELNKLVNGKIVGAFSDKEDEFFGLQIEMPNGKTELLWFLMDDEGNGPGSFQIEEI